MKRFLSAAILTLVCGFFSFGGSAAAYTFPHKLNITFTGSHVEPIPYNDSDSRNWNIGYKFTIFNAENCKTTIKIQMMHLAGRFMSLSIKDFVGNWPDRTAQDVITSMPRTYRLYFENTEGECKNIRIKGTYGAVPEILDFSALSQK
ncbi:MULTISPECIES: hypothetical protein [Bacillus]|uniref:YoaW n=1 Tax=Bacillus glycinifermentans TaxID=1664069 RepID=A0AAJ3YVK5_9BACI|nr:MULTISPECIES: hypothetical protein [Bacillus]KKB73707.1 hypothetical protein TH62_11075 [Bacillus sp. TH008]MDU0072385.1 hypothetical protein [Bacillus sp. IG6]MED8020178.1 hypothetical protein [Bacillus glycinifermentans]QAT63861.1 hypothetical protein EQZ20_02105 [Bacillus glycinifermentans]WKB77734.1 hypothetical protein QYM22_02150 [Bacillus glycinifermentans]